MSSTMHPGEMLVKAGIVSAGTFEQALALQKESGKGLGLILTEMGIIAEEQWIGALAKAFNFKTVTNISSYTFAPELLELIPAEVACLHHIFPLKEKEGMLATAISDPFDSDALDALAARTGLKIIPFLAKREEISAAIKANYPHAATTATTATTAPTATTAATGAASAVTAATVAAAAVTAPTEPAALTAETCGAGGNRKVVVVDDSQAIAAIIQGALQKEGYRVFVGYDGLEGLKLAVSEKPDLIITDTVMPRLDGFGLLRALQGNPQTARIPVILLTAKSASEDEQRALDAGFLDFIPKPVQPIRVVSRVKRALELAQSMNRG